MRAAATDAQSADARGPCPATPTHAATTVDAAGVADVHAVDASDADGDSYRLEAPSDSHARWQHPRLLPVLDAWQRGFPLLNRPFAHVAACHGYDEAELMAELAQAQRQHVLSRVGGVFAPHTVGASTLAAVAVPPEQVEYAAACINSHPEVNHNYLREHRFNLWFVVAADTAAQVRQVLRAIAAELGQPVLDLPLEAQYHIDLGFSLRDGRRTTHTTRPAATVLDAQGRALAAALGHGLPLVSQPYRAVADALGSSEGAVLEQIDDWLRAGVLRRLGFIVRHHELGYTANAMCVWQVPLSQRDAIGARLAAEEGVHLCYGRPARAPHWPYNLFCMLHGQSRAAVQARIAEIHTLPGLAGQPHAVLFSTRRFRQRGARYGGGIVANEASNATGARGAAHPQDVGRPA